MRQNFNFVVQSVCDAPVIDTSYQKLPFGSEDDPDKLFHETRRRCEPRTEKTASLLTLISKFPFGLVLRSYELGDILHHTPGSQLPALSYEGVPQETAA